MGRPRLALAAVVLALLGLAACQETIHGRVRVLSKDTFLAAVSGGSSSAGGRKRRTRGAALQQAPAGRPPFSSPRSEPRGGVDAAGSRLEQGIPDAEGHHRPPPAACHRVGLIKMLPLLLTAGAPPPEGCLPC